MKKIDVSISYDKVEEQELTPVEKSLLDAARKATYRSYSPYSGFSVGAAVLLDDGTIVEGSNQENSSYPQGICAERTAIFYAGSRYPDKKILALCIAARGTDGSFTTLPVTPCGGCRQALLESEYRQKSPIKVLLYGLDEIYIISSAQQLLPLAFQL
jgi:cytidine deaminase